MELYIANYNSGKINPLLEIERVENNQVLFKDGRKVRFEGNWWYISGSYIECRNKLVGKLMHDKYSLETTISGMQKQIDEIENKIEELFKEKNQLQNG